MHQFIRSFREIKVLDFDDTAAETFKQLRNHKICIGTMDLKIAAIAIANDAILMSRNIRDFGQVPNLVFEDWT